MMLVSELIEETRRLLFTGQREERNKLSAALAAEATVSFIHPMASINRGAKLSIDLEDMYVWSIASQTATVDRGQYGSTVAPHVINSIVHVNPKFSNWEIFNAINDEINDLSSPVNGLFFVNTIEIEYNPVITGYTYTPSNLLDIYEVLYEIPGPSKEWFVSQDWDLSRNMSTAEFASGQAIFVRDAHPNRSIMVKGKFAFTELTPFMATDTNTTGVPITALDILSIGAAYRLTSPREVARNFHEVQGDTRRADEVPPGANLGGARELGRLRQSRIQAEAARLNLLYPARSPRYPYRVG